MIDGERGRDKERAGETKREREREKEGEGKRKRDIGGVIGGDIRYRGGRKRERERDGWEVKLGGEIFRNREML